MPYQKKLLVDEIEATHLLSILPNDLEWLISTQQLYPLFIRGHRLFEVSRLEELVLLYKTVQSRGQQ